LTKNKYLFLVTLTQIAAASNVSNTFDAVAIYVEQQNLYQIIINKDKIRYPFLESRDRRLNFTIAHELGHIFLDHLSIPDRLKTNTERYLEDLEANEFAGNLLMPENLMLKYNFVSVPAAAKHFNVSSAAMRRRLNNLQRFGLIDTKRIRACSQFQTTLYNV
jgi:Zn-dependent peptidase ImmA (M78 family)